MSLHDMSIDALLAGMPKKKRNQLKQRILKLIFDFNSTPPEPGGNVKSFKNEREKRREALSALLTE